MTVGHILFQIFIEPIILIFEVLYNFFFQITGDAALAIIPLSLAVNLLCLPLYLRADAIQKENRTLEKKMEPGLDHIKSTFKGDEKFMMIQAYYRVCGYKPTFVLRNSISLFLQIPFFIAAYLVLSNMPYLQDKSLGPLTNLGNPDGLLVVGGLAINILPIIMTAINLISSFIYAQHGTTKSEKMNMIGIALVFLVLLYNSPSGLVFYWILNQIFSLCKNIVMAWDIKWKRLQSAAVKISSIAGIILVIASVFFLTILKSMAFYLIAIGIFMNVPLLIKKKGHVCFERILNSLPSLQDSHSIFWGGCIILTVLTGLLIPSALISDSAMEFVNVWNYQSPLLHIFNSFLIATGLFTVWFSVFYYLMNDRVKCVFGVAVFALSAICIINYMFFGTNLGTVSPYLKFVNSPVFPIAIKRINIATIFAVISFIIILTNKGRKIAHTLQIIVTTVLLCMSIINIYHINTTIPKIDKVIAQINNEKKFSYPLSKKGKNVIVIMLDRAISGYVPYIMKEKPELKDKFLGFIWYPNTISYGHGTNNGSPGLYGGYEYTPEQMNKRKDTSLLEKHNEALRLMPVLFDKSGYKVTVTDPVYAGYNEIPDTSIYEEYPNIKTYHTIQGQFCDHAKIDAAILKLWERNIFVYSIMKVAPVNLQRWLYLEGAYHNPNTVNLNLLLEQIDHDRSVAFGINSVYLNSFSVLASMKKICRIEDNANNTFMMLYNDATHSKTLLSEPDYSIANYVNNTEYDTKNERRTIVGNRKVNLDSYNQMSHYHVNMAALTQIGRWLDYLRNEGVYDNTRIIIVSDHGFCLRSFNDMLLGEREIDDVMWYNALLMTKDFDSKGDLTTDNTFMTNADTPTLAFRGLIKNPVNPATGKKITNDAKYEKEHHIFQTDHWQVTENNGTTFMPGNWFVLYGDNIFDMNAWKYLGYY